MTRYLHGIHDIGGEHLHGDKPGWTLDTVEVGLDPHAQGHHYTDIDKQGIGVIVRLNHGYGSSGTIPLPDKYEEFAAACASFAATSTGVEWYIIGNEPNGEWERPNGVIITAAQYARCFAMCRNAIKQAVPSVGVMHAAIGPYHANPTVWYHYLAEVLERIEDNGGCDGINLHAYTRSMNPDEITSNADMGGILKETYSGFWTYRDAFEQVPASMLDLPAFITEFDAYHDWQDQNTGVITAMYDDVHHWNSFAGQQPKIVAALCFRWLGPPDVNNAFDWEMRNKPELLKDFVNAVTIGYKSPIFASEPTPVPPSKPSEVFIPSAGTGGQPMQADIDPRLKNRGVVVTEIPSTDPDEFLWKLVSARYFNEAESQGRHHVYVERIDENGRPLPGMAFTLKGQGSTTPGVTNDRRGFDAANVPMWASEGKNGYTLLVNSGDSVSGIGMGEDTPNGFNAGAHTSQLYTYQRKRSGAAPTPVPVPPSQQPSSVPTLVHPVADPRFRIITQEFGARPEVYSQFKIDGVPLRGHEGIDFGTPIGTQIRAVDRGTVTEVADQGNIGYGRYIKVVHAWGETVYAHLEEQWVKVGDRVEQAQLIGKAGFTGNVEPKGPAGAHLHFGLRVRPFNRQDGWGGYTNPKPYLPASDSVPTPTPVPSPDRNKVLVIVKAAAQEFGLNWRLLASLVHGESSFNPLSENLASGAKGLGNIMPLTWGEWAPKVGATNIFDAKDNARVTAAYLAWCLNLVGGNVRKGLWCYNWSPRDVPKGLTPPPETIEFASKIIHGMEVLEIANP